MQGEEIPYPAGDDSAFKMGEERYSFSKPDDLRLGNRILKVGLGLPQVHAAVYCIACMHTHTNIHASEVQIK